MADEDVELGGVQALNSLVVDREVQDPEEVFGVLVDLRSLALRKDVLQIERVPAEALGEGGRFLMAGIVEVNPGQAVRVELCNPRLRACGGVPRLRARSRALDAGKAWHRD